MIYIFYHDYSRATGAPGGYGWVAEVRIYGPFNDNGHAHVWAAHELLQDSVHEAKVVDLTKSPLI